MRKRSFAGLGIASETQERCKSWGSAFRSFAGRPYDWLKKSNRQHTACILRPCRRTTLQSQDQSDTIGELGAPMDNSKLLPRFLHQNKILEKYPISSSVHCCTGVVDRLNSSKSAALIEGKKSLKSSLHRYL